MRRLFAALLVAGLGTAAFAFGPLLPWSPVKPGYVGQRFQRAEIFHGGRMALLDDYREIDSIMADAERFHRLRYQRPVKVIVCKGWGDCERALPWLKVRGLGGVTLSTGDVSCRTRCWIRTRRSSRRSAGIARRR